MRDALRAPTPELPQVTAKEIATYKPVANELNATPTTVLAKATRSALDVDMPPFLEEDSLLAKTLIKVINPSFIPLQFQLLLPRDFQIVWNSASSAST